MGGQRPPKRQSEFHAHHPALFHGNAHWSVNPCEAAPVASHTLQSEWYSVECAARRAGSPRACRAFRACTAVVRPAQVEVKITPGTHQSEAALNKQLNDKERVAAALENGSLLELVNKCIAHTDHVVAAPTAQTP